VDFIELTNIAATIFDNTVHGTGHEKAVALIKTLDDIGLCITARQSKGSADQQADNSDYTAALRSTIETWLFDSSIAEFVDDKGIIDLMQRLNALKTAHCA